MRPGDKRTRRHRGEGDRDVAQHEAAPPTQSTDAVPASLWSGGNGGAVVPQIRQLGGGGEQEHGCLPVLFQVPWGSQQDVLEGTGSFRAKSRPQNSPGQKAPTAATRQRCHHTHTSPLLHPSPQGHTRRSSCTGLVLPVEPRYRHPPAPHREHPGPAGTPGEASPLARAAGASPGHPPEPHQPPGSPQPLAALE